LASLLSKHVSQAALLNFDDWRDWDVDRPTLARGLAIMALAFSATGVTSRRFFIPRRGRPMSEVLKVRDTVCQRCGGPYMRILAIDGENARCEWTKNHVRSERVFRLSDLLKAQANGRPVLVVNHDAPLRR
jgi:hypothetical protein